MSPSQPHHALQPALEADETVSWSDTPVAGAGLGRGLLGLVLFLAVVGGSAYVLLPSRALPSLRSGLGLPSGLFSDPHLLVPALALAALPLLGVAILLKEHADLRRTVYAITDRRLLAVRGSRGNVLWALPPEKVAYVKVRSRAADTGDLIFNRYVGKQNREARGTFTFQRIPRAEQVSRQVDAWLDERRKEAVAEADELHPFVDPVRAFRLAIPSRWRQGSLPRDPGYDVFHVLADQAAPERGHPHVERVLEAWGPLGASLVVDAAPAGTWARGRAAEMTAAAVSGAEVVEGPNAFRAAGLDGFAVVCEARVTQRLRRWTVTGPSVKVGVETVVLTHGSSQLRFCLGWMSRFSCMRTPLEHIVQTVEPLDRQDPAGTA